jgi:hypothetical protein
MPSTGAIFCAEHACTEEQFERRFFWRSLYWHAMPIALLLGGRSSRHFRADRQLIASVARAAHHSQLHDDIAYYFLDASNQRWSRLVARIRISTTRLRKLLLTEAERREHPGEGSRPPHYRVRFDYYGGAGMPFMPPRMRCRGRRVSSPSPHDEGPSARNPAGGPGRSSSPAILGQPSSVLGYPSLPSISQIPD